MNRGEADFDVTGQLGALRRYARSLTRDETEAEDLVHDALVRALERRRSFDPGRPAGSLRTWLMSILHNVFIDDRRQARAEAARVERAAEQAPRHTEAGQDAAVRLAQVRQAFHDLSPEQRAALHLVAIEGMPYSEAAAALGVPVGTLMSRLGRARAALRAREQGGEAAAASAARSPALRIVGGSDGHPG